MFNNPFLEDAGVGGGDSLQYPAPRVLTRRRLLARVLSRAGRSRTSCAFVLMRFRHYPQGTLSCNALRLSLSQRNPIDGTPILSFQFSSLQRVRVQDGGDGLGSPSLSVEGVRMPSSASMPAAARGKIARDMKYGRASRATAGSPPLFRRPNRLIPPYFPPWQAPDFSSVHVHNGAALSSYRWGT